MSVKPNLTKVKWFHSSPKQSIPAEQLQSFSSYLTPDLFCFNLSSSILALSQDDTKNQIILFLQTAAFCAHLSLLQLQTAKPKCLQFACIFFINFIAFSGPCPSDALLCGIQGWTGWHGAPSREAFLLCLTHSTFETHIFTDDTLRVLSIFTQSSGLEDSWTSEIGCAAELEPRWIFLLSLHIQVICEPHCQCSKF